MVGYRVFDHRGSIQKPGCEAKSEKQAFRDGRNYLMDHYGGLGYIEIFTPKDPVYYSRLTYMDSWSGPERVHPLEYVEEVV